MNTCIFVCRIFVSFFSFSFLDKGPNFVVMQVIFFFFLQITVIINLGLEISYNSQLLISQSKSIPNY